MQSSRLALIEKPRTNDYSARTTNITVMLTPAAAQRYVSSVCRRYRLLIAFPVHERSRKKTQSTSGSKSKRHKWIEKQTRLNNIWFQEGLRVEYPTQNGTK